MKIILSLIFILIWLNTQGQNKIIKLYDGASPGLKDGISIKEKIMDNPNDGIVRIRDITEPSLTVFVPKNKTSDAAVVVCPGGGYYILAWDHEGTKLGEWFAKNGVTAFVLKYRLPQHEFFNRAEIRPLQDAQQAFRYIRKNAQAYKINENKIGIMGFSAGGHLAATASTQFDLQVGEIVENHISVRPDFSILIYPVVSFSDKYTHSGSRSNLLNNDFSSENLEKYSNEKQIKPNTPPTFIVHAFDDPVSVYNSLDYAKALKAKNIPTELHIYDKGGHGFSMKKSNTGPVAGWPDRLSDWMKSHNWMK